MIYARVIVDDCVTCREKLLLACRNAGLPLPVSPVFAAPEEWIDHECEHKLHGFVIEKVEINATEDEDYEAPEDEEVEQVEGPDGWLNLDATKNWGYPAREQGRYGSYPTHDNFGDESEP